MDEQLENTVFPYLHIFDNFTVFFHGNRVYVGEHDYSIGQCVVDVMNMDNTIIGEIVRRVTGFSEAAHALLKENTEAAARSAQEKLNAVWEVVFSLPVYRDLQIDTEYSYHMMKRLFADKVKWERVRTRKPEEFMAYESWLLELLHFPQELAAFRQQIAMILEQYFEPLEKRNSRAYADAYTLFYSSMMHISAQLYHEPFEQSVPLEVSFVPMLHQTNANEIFLAEKTTFRSLTDFLRVEFYRGLTVGNAPRRCHNCGKYFLLTQGYNTCYCNNIAPNETDRTCRKVGAHRKEAQDKANRSPARIEYDRVYNRLKQQKNRKKISVDEWNTSVAEAMRVLEQAERGELTDDEMRTRFRAF